MTDRVLVLWLRLSNLALAGYLASVLLLGRTPFGIPLPGGAIVMLAIGAAWIAADVGASRARRAVDPATRMRELIALPLVTVATLLALDGLHASYRNRLVTGGDAELARFNDAVPWIGEVYPPLYWDAATGVRRAKPGYRFRAAHYGDAYTPAQMTSDTLRREVFSLKHVGMTIDRHGFRNAVAPDDARVFALGDSFTFGWGVPDGHAWPARLGRTLGTPVYNLGVHDSSPVEEVARLRLLLDDPSARFRPEQVVWLLFEGNDLEDSRPLVSATAHAAAQSTDLLAGTLLGHLLQIPWVLKQQSVIDMGMRGALRLVQPATTHDPWTIDGQRLPNPVFHSATHGHMIWLGDQLARARAPQRYVTSHPNHARMLGALQEMAALAARHGFTVTLAVAPTAARVYAAGVDDLDAPLAPPFLIDELHDAGRDLGFTVVDLLAELQPLAATELLYFRDDDHWNDRGHAVVAERMARALRRARPGRSGQSTAL